MKCNRWIAPVLVLSILSSSVPVAAFEISAGDRARIEALREEIKSEVDVTLVERIKRIEEHEAMVNQAQEDIDAAVSRKGLWETGGTIFVGLTGGLAFVILTKIKELPSDKKLAMVSGLLATGFVFKVKLTGEQIVELKSKLASLEQELIDERSKLIWIQEGLVVPPNPN